ncbi:MAG TPA: hypothetical protein PLE45_12640 [Spirochaetota bacterium]|nr:hypothetical protein [Spirochaetota bacterium]HPP04499.1 hypothetical protein [Spirochaetota bacterium]
MKFLAKIIFLISTIFLLFSCYTQKIELNADRKSGKMTIDYYINNDYFQIISLIASNFQYDNEDYIDVMILIDENKFKENFKKYEGITLDFVSIKKIKEGEYKGKIIISFKDFEKALALLPKGVSGLELIKTKDDITISQTVDLEKMDPDNIFLDFVNQLKDDDKEFYTLLTETAVFNFELYTKTNIKKTEGIKLEGDGKIAKYSFKIKNLLDNKNKVLKFSITL